MRSMPVNATTELIPRKLREARERLNLSRKDAADRVNHVRDEEWDGQGPRPKHLTHTAIGHYETGYRQPTLGTFLELAQAYETAPSDLLPRERGDGGQGPATDITVRVRPGAATLAEVEEALVASSTELGAEAFIVTSSLPNAIPERY